MEKQSGGESPTPIPSVESLQESPAPNPPAPSQVPAPPPNGGLTAWLQVLGAHFLFFNSWGIVNTFGAYQVFYEGHQLSNCSPSSISWIGTVQGFLLIVIGVITGPLYDLGYLRALIYTGTFLSVFGLMMTSLAKEYYQVFLSLGICVGLGSGCLFVPSVAIVSQYFSTRRSAATGLAAAGGSLSGVLFPIIFRRLQVSIGFGWATRVIAFIVLATLSVSAAVLKPRILPARKRKLFDRAALTDVPYVLFSFSLLLVFIGLYIPFFYIPSYAQQKLDTSKDFSFYLLAVLNAASIFGRIGPNILADKVGALKVLIPFTFVTGILPFAWTGTHNIVGVVLFCILYGFFSGAIVSLPPTALVIISPDLTVVGTRMGMSFSLAGFGLLIGAPIGGIVLKSKAGFMGLGCFSGATVLAGFICISLAYWAHRLKRSQKAADSS